MYKLRIKVFLALAIVAVLVMTGRLVHLQVVQADHFRSQAEQMLRTFKILPAGRGRILDRNGKILADNRPCWDFCMDYGLLTDDDREYTVWARQKAREIARQERVSPARAVEIFRQREAATWRLVEWIAAQTGTDLDANIERIRRRVGLIRAQVGGPVEEQYEAHAVIPGLTSPISTLGTVGVEARSSLRRYYPFADQACHVIGLTGQVNRDEQERWNLRKDQVNLLTRMRRNYHGGDMIGKSGVEKMCEKILRGERGFRRFERRTDRTLAEAPAVHGRDVHLTIDIELQKDLTKLFRDAYKNGSMVVLSVPSGAGRAQVLAMVSVPTFDLNRYRLDVRQLVRDELNTPLVHRAVAGMYPPGSTIKPVTALAGLGAGAITPETTFICKGYLHTPDKFRCWIWKSSKTGHGELNLVGGLTHSCNIYFYEIANMIGSAALVEWHNMFGLSRVPGTGLPEERKGKLPSADELRGYGAGPARMMAIGQGPIAATPLHIATVMATIARRGVFTSPQVALEGGPARIQHKIPVTDAQIDAVHEGMYRVVNDRGGTAYKYFHGPHAADRISVEICGKTGTATVPPQKVGDVVMRRGDMAWFSGFAPRKKPQIALAVVVEYVEGGGGENAAPLAREAIRICKRRGYVE